MAKRKSIDWESIENEVRANQFSIREIARRHNISDTAIHKRIKSEGLKRNLSKKIKEQIKEKLVCSDVVCKPNASDKEIIDKAANRGVTVVKLHRNDVQKSQKLVNLFQNQLEEAATSRDDIEDTIIEDTKGKDGTQTQTKKRNMMLRAVSLPSHAGVLRDLSVAQKNLIYLERQAWNLNDTGEGETIEDVLRRVMSNG